MRVRAVGAEDSALGGGVESGPVDGVAAHRRRRPVRVSLSAARMGSSPPVRGVAIPKEGKAEGTVRTRAIPVIRHTGIQLSGIHDQPGCAHRRSRGFLPTTGRAENLIKEANNDAGLAAHPSARWSMNCVHFQLAMLAYNLNCWLMLFNRDEQAKTEDLHHTTLATARLRFLFLAAKIVRHAGAVLVRYSDHYAEQGTMTRLMDRLRSIVPTGNRYVPVLASALRL